MTPSMLLPPQNPPNGAQPATDESEQEAPPQGDVTARQVRAQLLALDKEIGKMGQQYQSFQPFAEAISKALTEGFFAIQEQLDSGAQSPTAPQYL